MAHTPLETDPAAHFPVLLLAGSTCGDVLVVYAALSGDKELEPPPGNVCFQSVTTAIMATQIGGPVLSYLQQWVPGDGP